MEGVIGTVLVLVFVAWGVYSVVRAPADRRLVEWTLAVACAAETGAVIAGMMFLRAAHHEVPGHALGAAGQ